ncbi:hypothetical protein [[Collinsella] massiliensis]|uniref:Uncharacterized protein n=1 Tax=[Collinsella] massiliensis TaxID=1232426 RepID=A0A1Y3XXI3_9ACTN|nr:hypothetical protein [[Collinsella] massiliensis]OUN87967.1 hypothetical protein B5G02_06785 [[Collinsella] massiliensis]
MDMAEHTCKQFDVYIHDIQVVELPQEALKHALLSTRHPLGPDPRPDTPSWAQSLEYGRAYHRISWKHVLSPAEDAALLEATLSRFDTVYLDGSVSVADVLDVHSMRSDLLFDSNTMQWLLLHEMKLSIPIEVMDSAATVRSEDPCSRNWYAALRDCLVRSSDDQPDNRAPWIQSAEDAARLAICSYFYQLKRYSLNPHGVRFPPNCGNLSFFYVPDHPEALSPYSDHELCSRIARLGHNVERIDSNEDDALRKERLYYDFGGRYHTIIVDSQDAIMRYMPLQFHAQYCWAYLRTAHTLVCDMEDALVMESLSKQDEDYLDRIINNIHYEQFLYAEFSRSVQADTEILAYIDRKWSLTLSLTQLEQFANNLAGTLERSLQRSAGKTARRQEIALFALSLIQLIALVSVWADYLNLVETYGDKNYGAFPWAMFGSESALNSFNVLLPWLLIIVSICIMIWCLAKIARHR